MVRSDALLAIEDVLDEMSRIISDHPAAMEYETDALDTWPKRWGALLGYLKAKRDIANDRVRALLNDAAAVLRARSVPPVAKPKPEPAADDRYKVNGYVADRDELCRVFGALQEAKTPKVTYLPCAPENMAAEAVVQTQLAIERAIAHLKKALPDGAYRKLMGDEQQ